MNKDIFVKLFYALRMSKGLSMDTDMCDVWYDDLRALPEDKLGCAMQKARLSSDGFPSVGKIVELCSDSVDYHAAAIEAWGAVQMYIEHGLMPKDALMRECVDAVGGVQALGYMEYGSFECGSAERRFIELYAERLAQAAKLKLPQISGVAAKQIGGAK